MVNKLFALDDSSSEEIVFFLLSFFPCLHLTNNLHNCTSLSMSWRLKIIFYKEKKIQIIMKERNLIRSFLIGDSKSPFTKKSLVNIWLKCTFFFQHFWKLFSNVISICTHSIYQLIRQIMILNGNRCKKQRMKGNALANHPRWVTRNSLYTANGIGWCEFIRGLL